MAGTVLGAAFSLLLFASFVQGFQDVEVFHYEAVAGQNISLPCVLKRQPDLNIIQIEWSIKDMDNTKLIVYHIVHGPRLFRPNVSIKIEKDDEKKLVGYNLQLQGLEKWDSGVYICDITTFPLGTIRKETELKVKDRAIVCDMNSTFEVNAGENVTIHCRADMSSDSQFRWTKDKKVVSENKSLKLLRVSDSQAGVYTLTVSAGNSSLHTEFIITVLTATTSLGTGLTTTSPRSNVSEEGLVQTRTSADIDHTTSPSIGQPSMGTNGKHATSLGTFPSFTNKLNISVTSPPATHSHTDRLHNSTDLTVTMTEKVRQEFNATNNLTTTPITDQASIYPEDSSLTRVKESSTLGTAKMNSENPGVSSTLSTGENRGVVIETGLTTMSPPSNVSEEGLVQTRTPADIDHTTSPSIGQPNLTVTMTERVRQEFNTTNNLTTTPADQATIYPEGSSLTRAEESSTLGTAKMNSENPGENTRVIIETDTGGGRSYLLLIIFPVLVFFALVGILHRRHIIKKRMDLPPSFKPPPPPVKYSAVRLGEIPTTVTS